MVSPPPENTEELFRRYLEICNLSLAANKDHFPYKHIWDAAEKVLNGKPVSVAIYDDRPQAVYQLSMQDKHINVVAAQADDKSHAWHMNLSYLEKVVAHPEDYIKNPAKIDWDWLRNRLDID